MRRETGQKGARLCEEVQEEIRTKRQLGGCVVLLRRTRVGSQDPCQTARRDPTHSPSLHRHSIGTPMYTPYADT